MTNPNELMTNGYPAVADIADYLDDRGIELISENNWDFSDEEHRYVYGLLNMFDWAGALGVWLPSATTYNVRSGSYRWGQTVKTYTAGAAVDPADNDTTYIWMTSSNTISAAVDGTGWPTSDHIKLAEIDVDADGVFTEIRDLRGQAFLRRSDPDGFIPVPLASLREVASNDIPNAAAIGGTLAKDTTPILEYINGDTDSCLRLNWAAGNADPVLFQVPIPPDLDTTADITLHCRIASEGTTNAVGFDVDTFFDEGDTKVEDATETNQTTTYADKTATIAADDVPAGCNTMSVELTPVAHTTDDMYLTAIWLTYTKI